MPKNKVDPAQAYREVRASWESRGFRADYLNSHQYEKDGDQYGELAYQRAFAEAAKKDPPRLPNPSHYPNSPSAQDFLQRRNNAFFAARPPADAPISNPKYESPIPDRWKSNQQSPSATPAPSQQAFMPPPPPPAQNGYAHVSSHNYNSSSTNSRTLPSPMEPRMGAPMGPPSRFK